MFKPIIKLTVAAAIAGLFVFATAAAPKANVPDNTRVLPQAAAKGDRLPLASADVSMAEAIVVMTEKALGCLGVVDGDGVLAGIITDGDLRRHMGDGLLARRTGDIMTPAPKTVTPDLLASAALEMINASSITALFVVEDGRPVGIIHIHDLLRAGVA